jgi:hypothetical protein
MNVNVSVAITIHDVSYRPVFYLKHDVSEIRFCSPIQTEASSVYWAYLSSSLEDENRIQTPKCRVLNKRQNDG